MVTPGEAPRLTLKSTSRAADAGHLAAADIAEISTAIGADYRLVGGNAISLLVWLHEASALVPARETADADLGAPPEAIASPALVRELTARGYGREGGNRFVRTIRHDDAPLDLIIDVLAPSLTGQLENNQPQGELFVDAVPGLGLALSRAPDVARVSVLLTNGALADYEVRLPDAVPALCMKACAYRGRFAQRDAFDIWRLLEVANAVGRTVEDWPRSATGRDAAEILFRHFARPDAGGAKKATRNTATQARIRALVRRIVREP